MEEELLEIIEKNKKSLNNEQEQIKKVAEEETKNHKIVMENGKFDKSSQYYKYEKDLTKIEKERKSLEEEKNKVIEKQEKEKAISEEKEKIKKMQEQKEQLEEAIKEEEKGYIYSKGKFAKTPILEEYKNDLAKINNEINARMIKVLEEEKELEILKIFVNNLAKKYNIKEEKDKTEKEIKKEDRETKTQKEEFSKEAKSESKLQENKVESKEKNKEDISEKIKKVEEEMKAEDRNYGAMHFNVDPKINKVNLKEEKEESPKKEETHTKAKQKIDDSQDNKTKEEYLKRKNDINDNSIVQSSEDKEEKLDVKIEIGRTAKIKLNGKEYKVGKNIIKEGLNISEDKIIDILKQKLKYESPKLEDIIRKGIKQKIIDSSVVNAIVSSKMEKEEEYQVLSEYIANAINAKVGKEYKNNCNVTYNKEDLSKANFLTRILKREINANEKVEMLHRAMVGERYATAISMGEYKPDLFSRIVSRVTGNKIPLLSQKIDSVQKVATVYNDLRDENKVNDKEKFRQELKANIRVSRFSDEQRKELEELRESQVKQETTER